MLHFDSKVSKVFRTGLIWLLAVNCLYQTEAESLLNYSDVWTKAYEDTEKLYQPDGQAYAQVPAVPVPFEQWDLDQIEIAKAGVAAAQEDGLKVIARLPFDYQTHETNEYIEHFGGSVDDHAVILLDGTVQIFPWNGNQRFCSNSPLVRDSMKVRVEVAVDMGADLLSVDLQRNSADNINQGACFCQHCMLGFRNFMGEKYIGEELAELEIFDIAIFDYQQFLLDRGWTLNAYRNQARQGPAATIPLFDDFLIYHYRAINQLHKILADHADAYAGRSISFLSSSDPSQIRHTTYIPEMDGFITEGVDYVNTSLVFEHETVLRYKAGDAVGKPSMITAGPHQWLDIQNNNAVALARTWIAQAYANSTIFMVPINQWTNPGRYDPDPAEFRYLYQFVQDNRLLFDEYESMAKVGLLYSHLGSRYGKVVSEAAVVRLVEENIPFELIFVGDELYERAVNEEQLARLDAIVLTDDFQYLTEADRDLFESHEAKTVHIDSLSALEAIIPKTIDVSVGNEKVSVTPRAKSDTQKLFHLVNSSYTSSNNDIEGFSSITISISEAFSNQVRSASLHAPDEQILEIPFSSDDGVTHFEIPRLNHWAILEVTTDSEIVSTGGLYDVQFDGSKKSVILKWLSEYREDYQLWWSRDVSSWSELDSFTGTGSVFSTSIELPTIGNPNPVFFRVSKN